MIKTPIMTMESTNAQHWRVKQACLSVILPIKNDSLLPLFSLTLTQQWTSSTGPSNPRNKRWQEPTAKKIKLLFSTISSNISNVMSGRSERKAPKVKKSQIVKSRDAQSDPLGQQPGHSASGGFPGGGGRVVHA
jgi:hypothetical protein